MVAVKRPIKDPKDYERVPKTQHTICYASDGLPHHKRFADFGVEIIRASCDDDRAWLYIKDGDLFYEAPPSATIRITVNVPIKCPA